jgi:phosphatidylinositol glycan class B
MSIVLVAIAARVWMALATRTFFQPDEFFQSLEVAHRIVFGYGKLTWEWQPATAIRSIVFPALYVPIYWILRVTGLDGTVLLVSISIPFWNYGFDRMR